MKKELHFSTIGIDDIEELTLEQVIGKFTAIKEDFEEAVKNEGYILSSVKFTLDGDGDSYGSSSYITVIARRYETDAEEETREKQEKAAEEKKLLQKEKVRLAKEAKLAREKELMEDSDYVFFKELEAKLKREGKLK